jgi:transcription initiation factor IIE alpha subunit
MEMTLFLCTDCGDYFAVENVYEDEVSCPYCKNGLDSLERQKTKVTAHFNN